jgi:hypothetical protein
MEAATGGRLSYRSRDQMEKTQLQLGLKDHRGKGLHA